MTKTELIMRVKELTRASIAHYRAVNEGTRLQPETAMKAEQKAIGKLFREAGLEISEAEIADIME